MSGPLQIQRADFCPRHRKNSTNAPHSSALIIDSISARLQRADFGPRHDKNSTNRPRSFRAPRADPQDQPGGLWDRPVCPGRPSCPISLICARCPTSPCPSVRGVQTQAPSSPSAPTRPRCPTSPIRPRRPRSETSEPKLRAVRPHRPTRPCCPTSPSCPSCPDPSAHRAVRACLRSPSEASEAPFKSQSLDAHTKSDEASEFALSDQSVLNGPSARSVQSDLSELSDQSDLSVLHGRAIRPVRPIRCPSLLPSPICLSGPLWRADFCPRHGKKRTNGPRSFPFNGESKKANERACPAC